MSRMRMNECLGLGVLSLLIGCGLAACGEDTGDGEGAATTDGSGPEPTTTGTTPGTSTPTSTPTGTPTGPGTSTPTATGTGTTPTPTGTGTAPAPMSTFPACGATDYTASNGQNIPTPALDGIRNIYYFGDMVTTACGDLMTMGLACIYGEAGPSAVGDNDYANWGAGLGLQLAQSDSTGATVAPWNATMDGVAGVKFTISSHFGRPVRVQMSQVNEGTAMYESNAFGYGTGTMSLEPDVPTTIMFTDFVLPSWTGIEGGAGQVLDPTKLHSLQFQVANNPMDAMSPYSFCVSEFQWVDTAGAPVSVGLPMDVGAGGMGGGGMATGGMGGMTTGGMGGMTTGGMGGMATGGMGGMATGGMGGMGGGDVPSFAADIHPIMNEKCMPCHDAGAMNGQFHGQDDVDAAFMSASMAGELISMRIQDAEMPMPPATSMAGPLTDDEIALILAWVEGGMPE